MAHGTGEMKTKEIKMAEEILFDQLVFLGYSEPFVIIHNNKKLTNYRIVYKGNLVATVKELIVNTEEKLKKSFYQKYEDFHTNILAHLISKYIIKKVKPIDQKYANYLWENHEKLTEEVYKKILKGDINKFEYYGKVWTEKQIERLFIRYIDPKLKSLF